MQKESNATGVWVFRRQNKREKYADLPPIEDLWEHLKHELRQQFPDTARLKGSPQTIKATLRERLHKIWWEIGEEVLNRLIEGMPKRVEEVIAVRGWYMSH